MNINFIPLTLNDLPLLLKWLEAPHVKKWWDPHVKWTLEKIENKYTPYTQGVKILTLKDGTIIQKPMHAFTICADGEKIGYIQYYNRHDFPPEHGYSLDGFSNGLAALDFYIGEESFLGQKLGVQILNLFSESIIFKSHEAVLVDPETGNIHAIRTYKEAHFKVVDSNNEMTWMIKEKP